MTSHTNEPVSANPLEPLVFVAAGGAPAPAGTPAGMIDLRIEIRALEGMQKEADKYLAELKAKAQIVRG